ncbi:hypothetical protein I3U40_00295 [Mycobacteroides abscessus subsp. abscessus]|uniref:hypothetical protein n=1 Tax=Mycobacteroides abscessus TaxID=36809 RepID=UPI0009A74037|nr:hypothetical protein [Mycobacteroides abscessus]QSM94341.1 hypothetical protein I3U31_00295 [Mycobacteroides abscessus subsp. abscessus]QSM99375.1 hypothetical protein I3U40_00295 [Mycobacteroides abscessus subsp. abscessus]SLJ15003.1 Uncharacterised protein [Mycobacteroides abscessus subsp. abscessus]
MSDDKRWTFTVKTHSPERDYTPQENLTAESAAYYLTRALIDFDVVPADSEDAMKSRLYKLITDNDATHTWEEGDATVTVSPIVYPHPLA